MKTKVLAAGFMRISFGAVMLTAWLLSACLITSSANAATYTWTGSGTNSNFRDGANWLGGTWDQWSDYSFGSAATSGSATIDGFFGMDSIVLQSGLTHDIVLGGANPVIMKVGLVNNNPLALISIDAASRNLTINTDYIAGSAVTWDVGVDRTLTLTGSLSDWLGTASIVKTGAGTASLTRSSSYSGGTTVNGGVLSAVRGSLGSGAVVVNSGGVLLANDQWVFSGPNAFGVNAGSSASLTVNAGGEFRLDATQGYANGITDLYLNGGSVTGGVSSTLGDIYLFNGNEQITAGGATASTIAVVVGLTGSNNTITVGGGSTLAMTGALRNSDWGGGNGGIIKSGDGTLTLSAANTYTGATTISQGTLQVGAGSSTGSLASATVVNNANLVYSFSGLSGFTLPSGSITGSGSLSGTAGTITLGGSVTQGGAVSLVQNASGGLYQGITLTGANTITGSSITLVGDVGKRDSAGNSLALDTSAANGPMSLDFSVGREFVFYPAASVTANSGTGTISVVGAGPAATGWGDTPVTLTGRMNITGNVSSRTTVTLNETTSTGAVSGILSGAMALVKGGTGTLTLSGNNTYSGSTTINEGTLQVGAGGSTGSLASAAIVNNANLVYSFSGLSGFTLPSGSITGSGNLSGTATYISLGGSVTQGGAVSLVQSSNGSLYQGITLTGANTITGSSITIVGDVGNRDFGGNSLTLDTSAVNGPMSLDFSVGREFVFFPAASVAASSGTGTISVVGTGPASGGWRDTPVTLTGRMNITGNVSSGTTVTLNETTATGAVSGILSGALSLVKGGAGKLTLTGSNTYTGSTSVNAGTLAVNGALGATAVTVASGATLGGSGSIAGSVNVLGTLAPGNSPGVITIGSLVLDNASTSLIEINGAATRGTDYDGVTVTTSSGLTYGGLLSFSFGNGSPLANGTTLDIFNFAGSPSGSFTTVSSTGFYSGPWTSLGGGAFELVSGGQTLTFSQATGDIIVVPEPGTLTFVGLGGLLAAATLRRRSASRSPIA